MDVQEVKEYNKIVIEVAKEMCRPWRWSTIILSLLLAGMVAVYFFVPATVDFDASNNSESNITQQG